MRHYEKEWPLLIICPSSVRYNWAEELSRWLPDLEPRHLNVIQNGNNDRIINPEVRVHIITFQLMIKEKLAAAIAAQYPPAAPRLRATPSAHLCVIGSRDSACNVLWQAVWMCPRRRVALHQRSGHQAHAEYHAPAQGRQALRPTLRHARIESVHHPPTLTTQT